MYMYYLIAMNNLIWTLGLRDHVIWPQIQSELVAEMWLELILVLWHGLPPLPILRVETKSKER